MGTGTEHSGNGKTKKFTKGKRTERSDGAPKAYQITGKLKTVIAAVVTVKKQDRISIWGNKS